MKISPNLFLKSRVPELAPLERLDWTEQIVFMLYGARIGVRTNNAAALDALIQVFPPHWRESSNTRVDWLLSLHVGKPTRSGRHPFHSLYSNGKRLWRSRDLKELVEAFENEMQMAVAQTARRRVFVHAGVVGWQGYAIVIPGRTYTGKSTLVREFVRAGATYYSDEYAVLDDKGRVYPFARPLALRDEFKLNKKISFAELGGVVGTKPLPVGTILVSEYRAGAKWRPRVLSPGMGALELLANTVTARTQQVLVLETLAKVTAQATILKSARDEARVLAPQLLAQLAHQK